VQAELVAFWVAHDGSPVSGIRVVPGKARPQGYEALHLIIELSRVHWDVEMYPVLSRLGLGDSLEEEPWSSAPRIARRDGIGQEQAAVDACNLSLSDGTIGPEYPDPWRDASTHQADEALRRLPRLVVSAAREEAGAAAPDTVPTQHEMKIPLRRVGGVWLVEGRWQFS
jgi:hypothetical protein